MIALHHRLGLSMGKNICETTQPNQRRNFCSPLKSHIMSLVKDKRAPNPSSLAQLIRIIIRVEHGTVILLSDALVLEHLVVDSYVFALHG